MAKFIREGYLSTDVDGFLLIKDNQAANCYGHLLVRNNEDGTIVSENAILCPSKEIADFLLKVWFSGAPMILPTQRTSNKNS